MPIIFSLVFIFRETEKLEYRIIKLFPVVFEYGFKVEISIDDGEMN